MGTRTLRLMKVSQRKVNFTQPYFLGVHSDKFAGLFKVEVLLQRLLGRKKKKEKKKAYYAVQILPKCSLSLKILSRQMKQRGARYRTVGLF